MSNLSQDPQEWLRRQFECEWCPECGRDHRHHVAVPLDLGTYGANWFAKCVREPVYNEAGNLVVDPEGYESEWTEVEASELKEIWDARNKTRTVFNGHTHVDLCAKYGEDNIKHVMGVGWFKRKGAKPRD